MKRKFFLAALAPAALFAMVPVHHAAAQAAQHFDARLAPTPRDTAMRETIAGRGSVDATLIDRTLTVAGTFEGLKSQATEARIHLGVATAARGPAAYALELSGTAGGGAGSITTIGSAGTISGVVELSDEALAKLQAGHLYIQLDSEGAPDGNLWGWLLRSESAR